MMSFPDIVSGLLRALLSSLHAIGSTYRALGTAGGLSGADLYAAELELQPWSATSSTTRKSAQSATVATRCAEYRNIHGFQLPELSRPVTNRSRSGEARASPIIRATSFYSDVGAGSQGGGGTRNSLEDSSTRPHWNAASDRKAVRTKQQASQLCWREHWLLKK